MCLNSRIGDAVDAVSPAIMTGVARLPDIHQGPKPVVVVFTLAFALDGFGCGNPTYTRT